MNIVSMVSAAVSVLAAAVTAYLGHWYQQRARLVDRRNYMNRYGASLAWAAFDLQSRLFNILRGHQIDVTTDRRGFLTTFVSHGRAEDADYARRSTAYVFGEYLGWVEILRRDIQFLELGKSRLNRDIVSKISEIGETLNRIHGRDPAVGNEFRIFRTPQRAMGDLMVHPDSAPGERRCIGYAEFCRRLEEDERFTAWFAGLLSDVDKFAAEPIPSLPRLEKMQHQLIELIDLLDPRFVRFPKKHRAKFGKAAD